MKMVTILIHVQEATFASGGKNKAVRKPVPKNLVESDLAAYWLKHQVHVDVIGHHCFQGEGDDLHPRPWSAKDKGEA